MRRQATALIAAAAALSALGTAPGHASHPVAGDGEPAARAAATYRWPSPTVTYRDVSGYTGASAAPSAGSTVCPVPFGSYAGTAARRS